MKSLYLFGLLLFVNIVCYGQQTVVKGSICDSKGETVPQVLVVLKQVTDSAMVGYAYSDDKGHYEVSYSGEAEYLLVVVSGLGIAMQTREVKNRTQEIDFIVKEEEFQLKEVVIKTPKIYYGKDTINYLVSAFSDENDASIGDVLKKMPGIDVAESGQISYQGKAINKFYIENMDLLNGRYGIATQNIAPKDVSTVQVLENHQPIKALDSIQHHCSIGCRFLAVIVGERTDGNVFYKEKTAHYYLQNQQFGKRFEQRITLF